MTKNWHFSVRALHWLSVPMMVACVGAMWAHEAFDKADPTRATLVQLHFLLGGLIGVLVVARLLARAATQAPQHDMAPKLGRLVKLGHLALYGLLLLLPVSGYIAVSGRGAPIDLLGMMSVPPLPVTKDTAHFFKEVHEGVANGVLALLALHVGMAVYHAVVLKDKVMDAMRGRAD